jgi:hypothetical protein
MQEFACAWVEKEKEKTKGMEQLKKKAKERNMAFPRNQKIEGWIDRVVK